MLDMLQHWQVLDEYQECAKILLGPNRLTGQQKPKLCFDLEAKKAEIFQALLHAHSEHEDVPGPLVFWHKPMSQVRTGKMEIKKGHLKLVPLAPLSSIGLNKTALKLGVHKVAGIPKDFYATWQNIPRDQDSITEETNIAAFWWVGTVNKEEEANMELQELSVMGMKLPIMKNIKAIPPSTRLLKYIAPAEPKKSLCTLKRVAEFDVTIQPQKKRKSG